MRFVIVAAAGLLVFPFASSAADAPKFSENVAKWFDASSIVKAKLTFVSQPRTSRSIPPIWTHQLRFTVVETLRGDWKKGAEITGYSSKRQMNEPLFPQGKVCIIGVNSGRIGPSVMSVVEATEAELKIAKQACSLPLGWTVQKGKLVSPWASMGKKAWDTKSAVEGSNVCSVTGRPATTVGADIEYKVEQVKPKVAVRFRNPDGDGEYRISLKNKSAKEVSVPALLTDGKNILWNECVVLRCKGTSYAAPGAKGVSGKVSAVKLKPGETISTVVHILKVKGPQWPNGGYRIEFQFCLGEKADTKSFYYHYKHHDPIRAQFDKKK